MTSQFETLRVKAWAVRCQGLLTYAGSAPREDGAYMVLPTQAEVRPVLLAVLAELGGRARPRDVYPAVTARFPKIAPEDLAVVLKNGRTNRWRNRIQWARQDLVLANVIDPSERGWWSLTNSGADLAKRGASPDDLAPRRRRHDTQPPSEVEDEPPEVDDPPIIVQVVPNEPQHLQQELALAAVDSQDPDRLERVVGSALEFLGYEVEIIGGAGRTDVLAVAPLGVNRYTVVLDAKSSAKGRISGAQIDWLSIRAHREAENADLACVVGPEFAGGQLRERASEFDTALLTASELGGLVEMHAATPLALTELRPIFESVPLSRTVLPQVRASARDRGRRTHLAILLVQHIDNLNRAQPDVILAKPETLLAAIIAQGDREMAGTTLDEVRKTLALLETVGILGHANGDGYASQTSLAGARQLLGALAKPAWPHATGETDRGTERAVGSGHDPDMAQRHR